MNMDERTCPECAEIIKKAANVCKHCGHRFRGSTPIDQPITEPERKGSKGSKIGCWIVVVGLVGMVSLCRAGMPDTEAPSNNDTQSVNDISQTSDENPFDDASKQHLWIIKSKEAIVGRLKDGESAKFKDVRFYSGGKTPVVCGQVNAKNGLGGYSGFERFIASGDNVKLAFLASDVADGDSIGNAWKELCVKAARDEAYVP